MKKLLLIVSGLSIANAASAMSRTIPKGALKYIIEERLWENLANFISDQKVTIDDLLPYDSNALCALDEKNFTLCEHLASHLARNLVTLKDAKGLSEPTVSEQSRTCYNALEILAYANKIVIPNSLESTLTRKFSIDKDKAYSCVKICSNISRKVEIATKTIPNLIANNNWAQIAFIITTNCLPPLCVISLSQNQNQMLTTELDNIAQNQSLPQHQREYATLTRHTLLQRTFAETPDNPQSPTTSFLSFTPKTYIAAGAVAIAGLLAYTHYRTLAQDDDTQDENNTAAE